MKRRRSSATLRGTQLVQARLVDRDLAPAQRARPSPRRCRRRRRSCRSRPGRLPPPGPTYPVPTTPMFTKLLAPREAAEVSTVLLSFGGAWSSASTSARRSPARPGSEPTSSAWPSACPALAPDDRFTYFSASLKERYPARELAAERPARRPADPGARPERRLEPLRLAADRPARGPHARPRPLADAAARSRPPRPPHRHAPRPLLLQAPGARRGRDAPRLRDARARPRASAPTASSASRSTPPPRRGACSTSPTRRSRSPRTGSTRCSARARATSRWTRRCGGCGCRAAASCTSAAPRSARTSSRW